MDPHDVESTGDYLRRRLRLIAERGIRDDFDAVLAARLLEHRRLRVLRTMKQVLERATVRGRG
jgi:hypothetical protein